MSHNSGSVGPGPPSPSKDEVRTALLGCRQGSMLLQACGIYSKLLLCYCCDALWLTNWFKCHLQGDGISPLVQTSVLGKGVKHRPPPIKLPSGSGSSSSGTCVTSDKDKGQTCGGPTWFLRAVWQKADTERRETGVNSLIKVAICGTLLTPASISKLKEPNSHPFSWSQLNSGTCRKSQTKVDRTGWWKPNRKWQQKNFWSSSNIIAWLTLATQKCQRWTFPFMATVKTAGWYWGQLQREDWPCNTSGQDKGQAQGQTMYYLIFVVGCGAQNAQIPTITFLNVKLYSYKVIKWYSMWQTQCRTAS